MSDLDLHILPHYRRDGQDQPEMPGLFVADAPRRAARSRKDDLLVLHLALTGTATINAEGQAQVLESLAESYFYSSGSVTAALRNAVEDLNQFLLDRNLKGASSGLQATGLLTILALHRSQLYIAQCGPSHVFTITQKGAHELHDPALAGRGLGLSRTPTSRLTHIQLAAGDLLLLTPHAPKAWQTPALGQAYNRGLRTIHHVVSKPAGENFNAVVIQAHKGNGRFYLFDRKNLRDDIPLPEKASAAEPAALPDDDNPVATVKRDPRQPISSLNNPDPPAGHAGIPEADVETPPRQVGAMLMAVLRAFYGAMKQVSYTLRAMITRILPGNELFTIPSGLMAFVAVAIPVLVVITASMVYLRRGQFGMYEAYMGEARQLSAYAANQSEPKAQRDAWGAVLFRVSQAERLQVTDETETMRLQARAVLDPLDGVTRLDFQPALVGGLGESVNIIDMVATRDAIYMFDETSGTVIRAWLSGRGYEIDPSFVCGPGPYGGATVTRLIDLSPLPRGNPLDAEVMALDFGGVAAYCKAGDQRVFTQPLAPPNSNWGTPNAFVLDSGTLFILDPQTNAVWVYPGADYSFVTPPNLFFDDDVPNLSDAIDLAVDGDDLYILHESGEMTTCTAGFANQQTRCTASANFSDLRAGMSDGPIILGTSFTKILFTPPPDPSIYLFNPSQNAVYHFSLRLTFQRQFRPLNPVGEPGLPEQASAFAVSPNRQIFLAFGNQVLVASLP